MVGSGKPGRTVAHLRRALLLSALLPVCLPAQVNLQVNHTVKLTLEQLNSRTAPNYSAVYAGQKVVVQGVVSAPAIHFPDYSYLAIDDVPAAR